MTVRMSKAVRVGVCGAFAVATASGAGVVQPAGGTGGVRGLSIKDLHRVEQLHGDTGGLSRSLARGPASLAVPNDFSGVYQIPEDADTPYAGWYARASGATIAVFPRGEYKAGPDGLIVMMPANTRFFLGTIPLGGRGGRGGRTGAVPGAPAIERVNRRIEDNSRSEEQPVTRMPAHDAPLPATVETAKDLSAVSEAVGKLCADPVYRANRVRELLERAARSQVIND